MFILKLSLGSQLHRLVAHHFAPKGLVLIPVSVHKFTHVLVSPSLTDPPDVVIQMNMPRYAWSDFESDDELMYLIFT
jgi:hypothetical protein